MVSFFPPDTCWNRGKRAPLLPSHSLEVEREAPHWPGAQQARIQLGE